MPIRGLSFWVSTALPDGGFDVAPPVNDRIMEFITIELDGKPSIEEEVDASRASGPILAISACDWMLRANCESRRRVRVSSPDSARGSINALRPWRRFGSDAKRIGIPACESSPLQGALHAGQELLARAVVRHADESVQHRDSPAVAMRIVVFSSGQCRCTPTRRDFPCANSTNGVRDLPTVP